MNRHECLVSPALLRGIARRHRLTIEEWGTYLAVLVVKAGREPIAYVAAREA